MFLSSRSPPGSSLNPNPEVLSSSSPPGLSLSSAAPLIAEQSYSHSLGSPLRLSTLLCRDSCPGPDACVLSSSSPVGLSALHATASPRLKIEQEVDEGGLGIAGVRGPQVCSGVLPAAPAADAVSFGRSKSLPASEAHKPSPPAVLQSNLAGGSEASTVSAPGARAPTVVSSDLWSQFFDALSRSDGPFSSFFHSLRLLPGAELGPTSSNGSRASRRVWPMPLPYPSLLLGGAGKARDSLQLGCNAVVLTLNWLYLGQPRVCPGGHFLHLGAELTPKQRKAVLALERNVAVWNSAGSFGPKGMGRSASKFEVLEDLLFACQDEWASSINDPPTQEARLKATQPTYARPVEPSRLNFPGRPSFDPVPFLDNANRQVYKDPLLFARPLAPDASLPEVRVHATRANAIKLLEVLDASGRLKLVPASELRPRLRNGVFALAKDEARDRMILDARAPNSVEDTECRWVRSLGTLEQLQFFILPPDCNLESHTEDLREFYHSFIISHQRCLRNALAAEFSYDQVKHLSCCPSGNQDRLVPCLATMAMGDCNAVAMGQCSHLACILRSTTLQLRDFVCLQQRPPRPGQVAAGLLIDDFVLLDPVPKVPRGLADAESPERVDPPGVGILKQVIAGYESAGLPRHAGKATSRSLVGEFWGGLLDGVEGRLRPHPRRTVPLASFLVKVVAGGISSVGMLEILAGGLVSALQLRRRLLCLLEEIYSAQRQQSRDVFVPVTGPLASELLCCAALVCQADIDMRAPGAPVVLCTDSSSSKEAAVVASVPPTFSLEASRHGLQRGLWNKLLSPLQAYLRETGELEDGEEMQSGESYDSHPLWETLCRALQFRALGPVRSRDRRVHINIGEVRAAIFGEERVGMQHGACRYIHLQDSQVALACFVKGRSCSPSINKELRRSVPFHLSHGVRPSFGFIRSRFNPSDDPTREVCLREPEIELPTWLREAFEGRFAEFDRFLTEHGVHPSQMTGLPDEAELLPDGPVDLRCSKEVRANRRSQGPEIFAKHLLGLSHVKPSDGLALFRKLPKETPSRESQPRGQACSFSAGVFVHGGVLGLRRNCLEYPESVQVFTGLIRDACPELLFSSFTVNQNVETLPHTDSHNADWEPNCVLALSSFRKGGIWTEVQDGTQPRLHKGQRRFGEILDLQTGPKLLDPKRLHATEGWRGTRVVLIAYTVRSLEKLSDAQRKTAEALGFKLPKPVEPGTETQALAEAPRSPSRHTVRPAVLPSADELKSRASSFGHGFDPPNLCGGSLRVEPAPLLPFSRSTRLSSAVLDLLNSFPPGRFLYSSVFPDLATAFRSGPGWLDLFSGFRGFGKGLVALAPCWVLCLDVAHDWSENLLGTELQDQLLWLTEEGAFRGFSAGPPSGSFSSAAGRAFRTSEHPQGRPGLSAESFAKVQTDNDLLSFLVGLAALATELKLVYLIENPRNSWMWKQAVWGLENQGDFLADMCVFGTRWKKATRVRTNGSLRGKRMLCGCNVAHKILRGRDKTTGVSWTKLSEAYPRRFSALLASASASDAGWLGERRSLDVARCAKCTGARIGEATKPGPRKARAPRPPLVLRDIRLVEPGTARLRAQTWKSFRSWLESGAGADSWGSVRRSPELLVQMLIIFGQFMYDSGGSLQNFRQLLAHAQVEVPGARAIMRPAWDQVTRWERLEPTKHRTPMPEPIMLAMCALALSWNWDAWAAVTLFCFYGACRIGEILKAERRDFLTPVDLLSQDGRFYLCIRDPKTRGRGPRVQHVAVNFDGALRDFFLRTWSSLKKGDKLFCGSPWMYRKRWDSLLRALGIPAHFRLTPGGLRGGGAVSAYRRGDPVSAIQWRMRLQHLGTLAFYLQEVSALSVIPQLHPTVRSKVSAAASLFPFLVAFRPAHIVHRP